MKRRGGLEKAVRIAIVQHCPDGVLVILDADNDCPATEGPKLLTRVRAVARDTPVGLVLAKCEFEAWFLAAAESLAGHQGLRKPLRPPANPEAIPKAKEWLDDKMLNKKEATLQPGSKLRWSRPWTSTLQSNGAIRLPNASARLSAC